MSFDIQPNLQGETIALRGLCETDRAGLYQAASDPKTWAGHPAHDRFKPDVFNTYFDFLLKAGGTCAIRDLDQGRLIGCSRYYVGPDAPSDIAIGFTFLNHVYWGGIVNFELKTLMLDHAFMVFERVWFHIDPTNIRSQKATAKLGAVFHKEQVLDLTGSGTAVPWLCLCLERDTWQQVKRACHHHGS